MSAHVTTKNIEVLEVTDSKLKLSVSNVESPTTLEVTSYDNGVVLQIPWHYQEELGAPKFEALKLVVRSHYKGSIETRTEEDPRFRRAATARAESSQSRRLTTTSDVFNQV